MFFVFQFLFLTHVFQNVFMLTTAIGIYVEPGADVTIPCSINVTPSNIQALYWQRVTNSTQGFETLYSFSKFTDLGWQSPVRGHVVNYTDLVLLNVSFSHNGIYNCRLLTHSKPEIIETSAYLRVILPLSEIKISKTTTGDVITDGSIVELLHGEETDVECAVVGKVFPPVSLLLQTSANNINSSIERVVGTSSVVKLNISHLGQMENITCRAEQIVAGRSYKTLESTFTTKRLDPRITISNCLDSNASQPGDCCVIGASSNMSKTSGYGYNISCEAQNIVTPWNITLFKVLDDQLEEETSLNGYVISVVDVPIDKNSRWLCVATHSLGESMNRSVCVHTNSLAVGYGKSNLHYRYSITGYVFAGFVILASMLFIIGFFIRKRRGTKRRTTKKRERTIVIDPECTNPMIVQRTTVIDPECTNPMIVPSAIQGRPLPSTSQLERSTGSSSSDSDLSQCRSDEMQYEDLGSIPHELTSTNEKDEDLGSILHELTSTNEKDEDLGSIPHELTSTNEKDETFEDIYQNCIVRKLTSTTEEDEIYEENCPCPSQPEFSSNTRRDEINEDNCPCPSQPEFSSNTRRVPLVKRNRFFRMREDDVVDDETKARVEEFENLGIEEGYVPHVAKELERGNVYDNVPDQSD